MAVNLFSQLESEFSADAVSKVASFLGETPAKTLGGLKYAIPAVVGGLFQQTRTTRGASELLGLLQRGGFDGDASTGGLLKGTGFQDLVKTGGPLVSTLFGPRRSDLTDSISGTSGLSKAASASLLALAGSYIANLVRREATTSEGFTAGSLANLLGEQGPHLAKVAPSGLAQQLGIQGWEEPARVIEPARAYKAPVLEPALAYDRVQGRGGAGWLKWALPLVLIPLVLWAWMASRGPTDVVATAGPTMTTRAVCGQQLNFAETGVEAKLIAFLESSRPIDERTWFTFDRLEFETGSPNLGPGSRPQIRNIAEIMKCYPTLNLKAGGYTDNVGDPAANMVLSQQRAENTMQAIVASGISPSRVSAEGYGEQFPVAGNDNELGRQRNRRIDLRVTQR